MTLMVSGALADAGNPIPGTIKATAVDNHDGTVTVYVRGQYNWLSHSATATPTARPQASGSSGTTRPRPATPSARARISAGLGVKTKNVGGQWPTDPNPIDQMVHPVDRGNQVEGYTVAGTDYPATQAFADPARPAITATQAERVAGRLRPAAADRDRLEGQQPRAHGPDVRQRDG